MNRFVSALLATIAYSKQHNLAFWTSSEDYGLFYSGTTCFDNSESTDWSDCSYYGLKTFGSEAILSWGLNNYWNDGPNS
jgi:hypothetical protein